jgi:hypothetical protein
MKIIDVIQGTPEWHAVRLGIPTASEFSRIITPSKGDLSKSCAGYAHQLVAETLLGRAATSLAGPTAAMLRGKELEPLARAQYAREHQVEVQQVGFVTTDDGRLGASPDGLIVGARTGLEIKCVFDANHVGIWADGPGDDYRCQVQASMAICELTHWVLYAWHPELPPVKLTYARDEAYIAKMSAHLGTFLNLRDELLARAKAERWEAREALPMPATFGAMKIAA